MQEAFPPLHSPIVSRHNLPLQLTSLVGRDDDLREIEALLARERLVTLLGPGGIGKTRAAIQAGKNAVHAWHDGVWLVELASIASASDVGATIAQTLGLRQMSSQPPLEALVTFLKSKRLLLVLDNCEHVIDAVREVAAEVLRDCEFVTLLTTGREALHVAGETVYRVPTLQIELAGELFAERARTSDRWMSRQFPRLPFCRYADDGLIHCRTLKQAQFVKERLAQRLKDCGLEIHPDKTRIVYCKSAHRNGEHEHIQFDFLGYTFRPRRSYDKYGRTFTNFTPAMARSAATALRQEVRSWRLQLKSDKSLEQLSEIYGPKIKGWIGYYTRFYASSFEIVARYINRAITRWAMRKFKKLRRYKTRAMEWLRSVAKQRPHLFPHWSLGGPLRLSAA